MQVQERLEKFTLRFAELIEFKLQQQEVEHQFAGGKEENRRKLQLIVIIEAKII